MNGLHYVIGAAHCTSCDFASLIGFEAYLRDRFAVVPFDGPAVAKALKETIWDLRQRAGHLDQDKALELLIADDLERVATVVDERRLEDPNEILELRLTEYEAVLAELGLDVLSPKLFIVDRFPNPYDTMDWIATAPDLADQQSYGIEPGNYFKRSHLTPVKSEVLLAHEMLHQVISRPDANWLGRGLEEGLAVVFGELYIGARVFGSELAYLYSTYHWFDHRASNVNRLYAEYARMATLVYQRCGLDGLLALVQRGRPEIKRVERLLFDGDFELGLPQGRWEPAYGDLLARVGLATVQNLVVSPLAKYVSRYVDVGSDAESVAEASGATVELVGEAFDELQEKVMVMLADGGRVDYSDVCSVIPSRVLRYAV